MLSTQLKHEIINGRNKGRNKHKRKKKLKGNGLFPTGYVYNESEDLLQKRLSKPNRTFTVTKKPVEKPVEKPIQKPTKKPVEIIQIPKVPEITKEKPKIDFIEPRSFVPVNVSKITEKIVPIKGVRTKFRLPPTSTTTNPFQWATRPNPTWSQLGEDFLPEILPEIGELMLGLI